MKKSAIATAVVGLVAIGLMISAFMANSSPYVTVRQASEMGSDRVHLMGNLVKNSVHMDMAKHQLSFDMVDANGDRVKVVHVGDPPANMGEATQIVAIGGMKGSDFHSEKLLIKCPSKYEGAKNPAKGA
ncbi:MAG: cytochrome c maturation protein CcmE [Fimbriimonas sp.]